MAIPSHSAERNGRRGDHTRRKDPHHPHHAYQWWPWDRKNLDCARKGRNVFPTAHEGQDAYHRYHAYQLVAGSVRLGGVEPGLSSPARSICRKVTRMGVPSGVSITHSSVT